MHGFNLAFLLLGLTIDGGDQHLFVAFRALLCLFEDVVPTLEVPDSLEVALLAQDRCGYSLHLNGKLLHFSSRLKKHVC